ncbi:unnamed protein product [Cuscuta epithymum]|uniref:Nucleotidyl transferase domain-containing protein n=1 Tax=Cuscuta epithymum TaxID=186058 RepID=A0AAV0DTJ6_9ASTE|nr:unnamed protein product [Cuscuta epithymum]
MEAFSAALNFATPFARENEVWWKKSKGTMKKNVLANQFSKRFKTERTERDMKPGFAFSVLSGGNGNDTMSVEAPGMERDIANPKNVAAFILGEGAGTQLFPLTNRTATAAVPVGGCYRMIDFPMSNCINSGINKIFVSTQFNSAPLNRHIARTYFGNGVSLGDGFVEVLAATQTSGEAGMKWFQGPADAVRKFSWVFEDVRNKDIDNILIVPGDQLYRMDYMDLVQKHIDCNSDITLACAPVGDSQAADFGLVKIDHRGKVVQFNEKPAGASLKEMQVDTSLIGLSPEEGKRNPHIASMGLYVFKRDILMKLLSWRYPTANDFGSEIIPAVIHDHNVQAYIFRDYWEDTGTLKSFYKANLALTQEFPKFEFYDPRTPFYTSPRLLPPTKIDYCKIKNAIISHGCFLRECVVEHSIVGERSRLDHGVNLKESLMMGADYYETESEIAFLLGNGDVPIGIGQNSKISNCIIDKNVRIGKDVIIKNTDGVEEADRPDEGFYIRSGITILMEKAIIKDGTVI